jgi:hypothetical protein
VTRSGVVRRGVAQLGSACRSGRQGRRFKSCHPDPEGSRKIHGSRDSPFSSAGARAYRPCSVPRGRDPAPHTTLEATLYRQVPIPGQSGRTFFRRPFRPQPISSTPFPDRSDISPNDVRTCTLSRIGHSGRRVSVKDIGVIITMEFISPTEHAAFSNPWAKSSQRSTRRAANPPGSHYPRGHTVTCGAAFLGRHPPGYRLPVTGPVPSSASLGDGRRLHGPVPRSHGASLRGDGESDRPRCSAPLHAPRTGLPVVP